jgi:hypothetical protein
VAVGMVAVTLSEELHDMVERLQEIEHGSPSKVFQEALRQCFGEPGYGPTDEERRLLIELFVAIECTRMLPGRGMPFGASCGPSDEPGSWPAAFAELQDTRGRRRCAGWNGSVFARALGAPPSFSP